MVWKGDANNRLAKSLVTLFDQIEQSFPNRKRKGNDGTIGNAAHQAEGASSDHNPHVKLGGMGIVTALDVTHDPANGFDAGAFAESLRGVKDHRIQYVIFNGRIFSSTVSPWTWRARNKGPGDHSEHVHISVVSDPALFDDTTPWKFDKSQAVQPEEAITSRTKLQLGDSGPAVIDLQNLLGITADGIFGPLTEQAVRTFQASRNLLADGIVGSHTWGALTETPPAQAGGTGTVKLPAATVSNILTLAGNSALSRVAWTDRGVAPIGYIKGMAVAFAYVYAKFKAGDSAAQVMAAANGGQDDSDALAWYDALFRDARMDNSVASAATLRHLFVLLTGLGMRESSGRYCAGRDTSATNTDADSAEAGLFQMSWNMKSATAEMARLFAAYSANSDGFLPIFQEGAAPPKPTDVENFGSGEGVAYQRLAKSCPAFAVETAAIGLRVRHRHWGPINRREAELRPEADALFSDVQGIIDALDPKVLVTHQESSSSVKVPQLLALILAILVKGKTMADSSAKPALNADAAKVLVPLLEALATGKQLDIAQIVAALSGEKPKDAPAAPADDKDQIGKLIDAIIKIVAPSQSPTRNLPVTNALGQTIGDLLDGKKTAIGVIGALATSLLSFATRKSVV